MRPSRAPLRASRSRMRKRAVLRRFSRRRERPSGLVRLLLWGPTTKEGSCDD
jgi:hypothetical protein